MSSSSMPSSSTSSSLKDGPDFSMSCWDLIRGGELEETEKGGELEKEPLISAGKKAELESHIDSLAETLRAGLASDDQQLINGTEKFLTRFDALSQMPFKARLASALHNFGSEQRGTAASIKCGFLRRGKRIGVQATATGRRKYGTKGKAPAEQGRPVKNTSAIPRKPCTSRYTLPKRSHNQMSKKRAHSLAENIRLGKQNGGKW